MNQSRRRRLMHRLVRGAAMWIVAAHAGIAAADPNPADPAELLDEIRTATLDLSHPLDASGLRLGTGFATLDLHQGVLIAARTGSGRAVAMVFVGRGQVLFDPPNDIEAGQLELFTGSATLRETFTEAVLVIARDAAATALLRRPAASDVGAEVLERAVERYAAWRDSPGRRSLGIDLGILLDALGDPLYEEYFAGWFQGENLGTFFLQMDPAAQEQISLGQFVRFDASDKTKRRLSGLLHREQRRGRLVGMEIEDFGRWDSWISTTRRTPDGQPQPGKLPFEPVHYELDVTVDPASGRLESRARIRMRRTGAAGRALSLLLHRDLEIRSLRSDGEDLFHLRQDSNLHVLLPASRNDGEEVVLEVEVEGRFLEAGEDRNWALRDSLGWYPRTGPTERATYDVTLRWPRGFDLVASGRRVDGGRDGDERWERRRMESPTLGFSFEVGQFEIETVTAGQVNVTVALDPHILASTPSISLAEITASVAGSLSYYQQIFGDYPLSELTVVTVPRKRSQAMLGFITLSNAMMADWGHFGPLLGVQDRSLVVAHEVAHQWWGHLVGWTGYRDQWISEAMANYAAIAWARHRDRRPVVGPVSGWQQELTATLADGRRIESLGPLVLGERLFSSRSRTAYYSIVYRKGALVLEMLARRIGEALFLEAMRHLIEAAAGRVLSTEDFLTLLERLTATDLDGFARQFIYGTGLPEVYWDYSFERLPDRRWKVRIVARQETPYRYRYAIEAAANGRFTVSRRRIEEIDVDSSELVVPIHIQVAEDPAAGDGDRRSLLIGNMVISGRDTEHEIEIDRTPLMLWVDPRQEVFGRFFDQRKFPKRMLLEQASVRAGAGEPEAAAELLERALGTPSPMASTDRLLDSHIRLELARLDLDGGRLEDAATSLAHARNTFAPSSHELPRSEARRFRRAFEVFQARLEIRRGEFERAFERLRNGILDESDASSTEGYLVFAIAAHATDHTSELAEALKIARERGADVSLLN